MFKSPENLLLLFIGMLWATLLWKSVARDLKRRREAFAAIPMLERIVGHKPTRRPLFKWSLILGGFFLLGISLARPAGGLMEEVVVGRGLDLVVALDVSESMNAPDIGGHSRLEIAKALLERMLNGLRNDRVGLVAFAGDTMVQCPITLDKNAFLTFLERVDPSLLTKPGTNIAGAIETCIDRFDMTAPQSKVIVLVSDGEDPDQTRVKKAIDEAKRKNIPVFSVGVGSLEGSYIPTGRDVWGRFAYKTFKGERVISKLDDKVLKQIARETNARYFRAADIESAQAVANSLEGLKRVAIASGTQVTTRELYSIPALMAFLLLLLEWMISERIPYEREKDHWLKRI